MWTECQIMENFVWRIEEKDANTDDIIEQFTIQFSEDKKGSKKKYQTA